MFSNVLWIEKYRPKKTSEMALEESTRAKFDEYISSGQIPHLLLSGPPGSGKSTIARILTSEIIKEDNDLLALNGSEQRGIGIIRDIVIPFTKFPALFSKHKIVWIEEADMLTEENQSALRAQIEASAADVRFLFTCNYLSKIHEAIQSRCTCFKFSAYPKEEMVKYCKTILDAEKVTYQDDQVNIVVDKYYPDTRKIVNCLETYTVNKQLVIHNLQDLNTLEQSIIERIINLTNKLDINSVQWLVKEISNSDIDYRTIYEGLFHDENFPLVGKMIMSKYSTSHSYALSPPMNLGAGIYELIQYLQNKNK